MIRLLLHHRVKVNYWVRREFYQVAQLLYYCVPTAFTGTICYVFFFFDISLLCENSINHSIMVITSWACVCCTFFKDNILDHCRESQGLTKACSRMPERDGKDQGEDRLKQAGSCWFARPCGLATSSGASRLVCRCHDVPLWCYLCFVLLRFRLKFNALR